MDTSPQCFWPTRKQKECDGDLTCVQNMLTQGISWLICSAVRISFERSVGRAWTTVPAAFGTAWFRSCSRRWADFFPLAVLAPALGPLCGRRAPGSKLSAISFRRQIP